jgi:hypothetical protein
MHKYVLSLFLLTSSISFADNYYITSGDAALEIYEREQLKQQRIRESFTKPIQIKREKEIKKMEEEIEKMANRF